MEAIRKLRAASEELRATKDALDEQLNLAYRLIDDPDQLPERLEPRSPPRKLIAFLAGTLIGPRDRFRFVED